MDIDITVKLNDWTLFTYKNSFEITLQEGWNMPNLENQRVLHFELQCQKLSR